MSQSQGGGMSQSQGGGMSQSVSLNNAHLARVSPQELSRRVGG